MERVYRVDTGSLEETISLGQAFGNLAQPGHTLLLTGDLGAGKTHFTKGVARGLGIPMKEVTSPTFVVMKEYGGLLTHVDLYRIGDLEELFYTGFSDHLEGSRIVVVEWAEKVGGEWFPKGFVSLRISITGPETRQFTIRARGQVHQELAERTMADFERMFPGATGAEDTEEVK